MITDGVLLKTDNLTRICIVRKFRYLLFENIAFKMRVGIRICTNKITAKTFVISQKFDRCKFVKNNYKLNVSRYLLHWTIVSVLLNIELALIAMEFYLGLCVINSILSVNTHTRMLAIHYVMRKKTLYIFPLIFERWISFVEVAV